MADLRSSSSCDPHFIQMARLPRAPFGEQTDLNDGLPPWILGLPALGLLEEVFRRLQELLECSSVYSVGIASYGNSHFTSSIQVVVTPVTGHRLLLL